MPGVTSGAVGAAAYAKSLAESFWAGGFFSWMFGFRLAGAVLPPEAGDTTVCSWLNYAPPNASGPSGSAFFFLSGLEPGPIGYWTCWAAAAAMPGIEGGCCESYL